MAPATETCYSSGILKQSDSNAFIYYGGARKWQLAQAEWMLTGEAAAEAPFLGSAPRRG
ncbi:hypothetical protein H4R24_003563 [Coemansia sp. RSA 988]|nr:hypothetical protein H4R24_003563 [Coemansia sp. RSA 988]